MAPKQTAQAAPARHPPPSPRGQDRLQSRSRARGAPPAGRRPALAGPRTRTARPRSSRSRPTRNTWPQQRTLMQRKPIELSSTTVFAKMKQTFADMNKGVLDFREMISAAGRQSRCALHRCVPPATTSCWTPSRRSRMIANARPDWDRRTSSRRSRSPAERPPRRACSSATSPS